MKKSTPPRPPHNFQVSKITAHSAILTWDPPLGAKPEIRYSVEYDGRHKELGKTTMQLDKLESGETYSVHLYAFYTPKLMSRSAYLYFTTH